MAKFEVYLDDQGEYRWRFRADNGKVIADGAEGYKARADCEHGIQIIQQRAAGAAVEDKSGRA